MFDAGSTRAARSFRANRIEPYNDFDRINRYTLTEREKEEGWRVMRGG